MEAVLEASMASELDQDAAPGAVKSTDYDWWQLEPPDRAWGGFVGPGSKSDENWST